ncbi:MAG: thioredoxin-disulfide reductase [Anaerolineae bacterium]
MQREKVIIIGSGPAGLTAALYTARAALNPLVIAGDQIGGQVAITSEVENYPGFPEGLTGPELVQRFQAQAERFGARLEFDLVTGVDFGSGPPFTVRTDSTVYEAWSVIITAGASPRRLGVPGEDAYIGRGVSYCGTCDGFFFRGKKVVVVGGGDSALEEGIFLTKFATEVQIIHRRDELRAGAILQKRAFSNPKISFTWDTVVEEIGGGQVVDHVRVRNVKTGETGLIKTDGVFIFIGHYPNSGFLGDALKKDEAGYLITDDHMMTSVPGVFAAGEIQDPIWRQVATSVGQGTMAAMACTRWLEEHEEEFGLVQAAE